MEKVEKLVQRRRVHRTAITSFRAKTCNHLNTHTVFYYGNLRDDMGPGD